MKCFTYVYARAALQELFTVLIIPSDFQSLNINEEVAGDEEAEDRSDIEAGETNALLAVESSESSIYR